jgi:hypothetical protein
MPDFEIQTSTPGDVPGAKPPEEPRHRGLGQEPVLQAPSDAPVRPKEDGGVSSVVGAEAGDLRATVQPPGLGDMPEERPGPTPPADKAGPSVVKQINDALAETCRQVQATTNAAREMFDTLREARAVPEPSDDSVNKTSDLEMRSIPERGQGDAPDTKDNRSPEEDQESNDLQSRGGLPAETRGLIASAHGAMDRVQHGRGGYEEVHAVLERIIGHQEASVQESEARNRDIADLHRRLDEVERRIGADRASR